MKDKYGIIGIITWVLLSFSMVANSQAPFFNGTRLGMEDGLPINAVRDIVQDKQGFIWLGTIQGICRYDGTKLKVYQNNPKQQNSILADITMNLQPTDDKIWVAGYYGLAALDIQADTFSNYVFNQLGERMDSMIKDPLLIITVYQDKRGEIWCGTFGLGIGKYIPEKDSFEFIQYDNQKVLATIPEQYRSKVNVVSSIQDNINNDSIIWFGTRAGLIEYNRYTKTSQLFYTPYNKNKSDESERKKNLFFRLYQHSDGLLYSTNLSNNIQVFNPDTKNINLLSSKAGLDFSDNIMSIQAKSDHELWLTSLKGLKVYNLQQKIETQLFYNHIKDMKIFGVHYIDNNNRIWATSDIGAFMYDPIFQNSEKLSFRHLYDTDDYYYTTYSYEWKAGKELFVLTRYGHTIFYLDRTARKWSAIPVPTKYQPLEGGTLNYRRVMAKSPWNNFTVHNRNSFFTFDPETWQFTDFPFQPPEGFNDIRDIFWDKKGQFWMSTLKDGLLCWIPKTGKLKNYFPNRKNNEELLSFNRLGTMFEDSQGNIWIKRRKGVSIYIAAKDKVIELKNPLTDEYDVIPTNFFAEDKSAKLWMWGKAGELGYADVRFPEKGLIKKYNMKEMVAETRWVQGVNTDVEGNIWTISNQDIIKIDGDNQQFHFFNISYVFENDFATSFDMLSTNEWILGMNGEVEIIDLSKLQNNQELARPYLTTISIINNAKERKITPNQLTQLQLSPQDKFFSIEFSAIGFTFPEKIKFRYRLKNYLDEWVDTKENRKVNFINVPGGDYTFQLQACNNEGIWNEEIYELPIHIGTPWYKTNLFGLVLANLLLGAAYAYYRERIRQIRKEAQLKSAFEKQKADLEMSALRAQMNPHFIFNCLNSIEAYIIKNDTKKASAYLNNFGRLIRLILQNSRTSYVSLDDELEALHLYLRLEQMRLKHSFSYKISLKNGLNPGEYEIPPMLIQPFVENAIWHGFHHRKTGGQVTISIQKEQENLKCIIEDNGIGRVAAAKINAAKKVKPKSMGLNITKERIKIINNIYEIDNEVNIVDLYDENQEPIGTRVILTIPI